jgi:hypothetical protein
MLLGAQNPRSGMGTGNVFGEPALDLTLQNLSDIVTEVGGTTKRRAVELGKCLGRGICEGGRHQPGGRRATWLRGIAEWQGGDHGQLAGADVGSALPVLVFPGVVVG